MATEDIKQTLLEQDYNENCPGCKVDRRKVLQQGVPYREVLIIWVVTLASALPISSLFPFLYFMVRDFHIAKEEEDISYYAGYVGSAFLLGRALTSVFWGMVADRYGRKVVIIFGTFTVVVLNTLFGLSVNLWMAIATRFLLGSSNGLLGPMKAYASELVRHEYQALSLSTVSTAWGAGLIIGPAIGGFFAQPADKFSALFSQESIFGRFPYFLPCLVISLLALVVAIACFWLPGEKSIQVKNTSVLFILASTNFRGEIVRRIKQAFKCGYRWRSYTSSSQDQQVFALKINKLGSPFVIHWKA